MGECKCGWWWVVNGDRKSRMCYSDVHGAALRSSGWSGLG